MIRSFDKQCYFTKNGKRRNDYKIVNEEFFNLPATKMYT